MGLVVKLCEGVLIASRTNRDQESARTFSFTLFNGKPALPLNYRDQNPGRFPQLSCSCLELLHLVMGDVFD